MKICTYNVNSIRSRKDLILQWLDHRGHDLDVLCFQEIKTVEETFPFEDFKNLGYQCFVFGQKTYNGVAICSQQSLKEVRSGLEIPSWDEQARVQTASFPSFHLINIYAPHGGLEGDAKHEYKQDWYNTLISFLNERFSPEDALILAGDFNVARTDKDLYAPDLLEGTIGTLPEEREIFEKLLKWGLVDVFRHLHPEAKQFTWWDYIGGAIWRDQGMRIDYVLASSSILPHIREIEVDIWPRRRRDPKPSDHAPVIFSLDV
ncbi:MAG: exodeoxyribonuclease III [Candidatus Aminicenantes bacterium]|nr:exodeoxyribonuclease III [Candidatus Aminicenantes bacterium]